GADQEGPEIRRVDLAGPALQLRVWGEADVARFPWFEPPRDLSVVQAVSLLRRLGAIDEAGVTALGRLMVRLPVHPRVARLLIEGQRLGIGRRAALAAALLSERSPFVTGPANRSARHRQAAHHSESDAADRVNALEEFKRGGGSREQSRHLNVGAAKFILHVQDQLVDLLEEACGRSLEQPPSPPPMTSD